MAIAITPVQETLLKAKNIEIQRAKFAEGKKKKNPAEIARHYLAAAHMELVLAEDAREDGDSNLAVFSLRSAAGCFFRAGCQIEARRILDNVLQEHSEFAEEIEQDLEEMDRLEAKRRPKPKPTRKAKS